MMLSIEIHFLTGRFASTFYNDRERAEWPPHPARLYSALVAALHDAPAPDPAERAAMQWLAQAGAPEIFASDAGHRQQGNVYVPANDVTALPNIDRYITALSDAESHRASAEGKEAKKAAKAVERAKLALKKRSLATAAADGKGTPRNAEKVLNPRLTPYPRTFPVAIPDDPTVRMNWTVVPPDGVAKALDRVASRVARLGHSSSLVSMRVTHDDASMNGRNRWVPQPEGDVVLRVAMEGQLERLEEAHEIHQQIEQRTLPARLEPYKKDLEEEQKSPPVVTRFASEGWLVFEVVPPPEGGRRHLLDISLAQHVARAFRGTLIRAVDGEWPECLSGHTADGEATKEPHLAFVPLADVEHTHASGSILGFALVPPRNLAREEREALLRGVALAEAAAQSEGTDGISSALRLTLGRHGVLHLRRRLDRSPTKALQPSRWTRTSQRWTTVTAMALGRNPGDLRSRDPKVLAAAMDKAEESVAQSCLNIGLPRPIAVWVRPRSLLRAAPHAKRFMPFPNTDSGPRRVCVHVEVLFDEPVQGPVILGAGRFFGLGLCIERAER